MRSSLRLFLLTLIAFVFASLILLGLQRDGWRQYLHEQQASSPLFLNKTAIDQPLHAVSHGTDAQEPIPVPTPVSLLQPIAGLSGADDPSGPVPQATTDSAPSVDQQQPPESRPERAVVMAKVSSQDTTWVEELPLWRPYVYTVDNQTTASLHTPRNKGREGMAYLTYIIDNYDNLADTIAFVHSHKDGYPQAWHTDNEHHSNVVALNALRTAWVQQQGYANLRCDNALGCTPPELQPFRSPKDPWRTAEAVVPDAWRAIFGEDVPVPDAIGTACCAQFAASRTQILRRPLAVWQRYRQWLLDTDLTDDIAGRILEYFWHIMLGQEPVFCPDVRQCYCDVYGMCG